MENFQSATPGQLYRMQLSPPAFLEIASADGAATTRVDIIEANRAMIEAEQKEEAEMAATIKVWLAGKLSVMPDTLSENTAFEFYETVVGIATKLKDDRKKKAESTVSSPVSIPASQLGCC